MGGRHAGRDLSRLRLAWLSVREVFVFAGVGLALPVALLVSVPQLLADGAAMTDAPLCSSGGPAECLDADEISLDGDLPLTFPSSVKLPRGDAHLLRWDGVPVGVLLPDGEVVEGLRWGRLFDVDAGALRLMAVWPLASLMPFLLVLRRHREGLLVLAAIGIGAAAAGPVAAEGLLRDGLRGMLAGGFGTLGIAFVAAGSALWLSRRRERYQARRAVRGTTAVVPAQRREPQLDPEVRSR